MATIRKSGGIVAFYWQGKLADPREEPFCAALAEQRFRTIENAASEEVSVGWVTPTLPTGDDFTPEDLDGGVATWLRIRIDKKVLPKKWLQIHLETEERARGKKLPQRERRELKQDIGEKLLPRVLPTVNLVDALMFHDRKTILLFGTSKSVVEAFSKLFFETFALPLDRANPYQCALRIGLDREAVAALDRVEPMRWPDTTEGAQGKPRPRPLPRSAPDREPLREPTEETEDVTPEFASEMSTVESAVEPAESAESSTPTEEATAEVASTEAPWDTEA